MVSKKKIAIIGSRGIPNNYGGFEKFTEVLSTLLVRKGVHVTVSCERNNSKNPEEFFGVELFYFPLKPPNSGIARNIYEFLYDTYSLFLSAQKADVIYMLGYSASFFFFIPKLYGKRLWVNPDGLEWKRSKFNSIIKFFLKISEKLAFLWADEIIADSMEIKKYIKSQYGLNSRFISYGVQDMMPIKWDKDKLPEILRDQLNLGSKYWLIVARLEPENNIHLIIKSYLENNLKDPLIVIGNFSSNKYKEHILNLIQKKPDKDVIFVGGIYNQDSLNMLRQNCFAYIHGHSVGGTNPSLLEIMAMKTIILAHENKFNKEVCGDTAIYFKDIGDLKNKMQAIDANTDSFLTLKENCYKRVKSKYSWDRIVKEYSELINQF